MYAAGKRLVMILTAIAFILAMSVQAVPSAEALGLTSAAQAADMDEHCPRMAVEHPDRGIPQVMPCKGIMPDCVKQMGCIGSPNLAARSAELAKPVSYVPVRYWTPALEGGGRSIEPDFFPPIGS